MAWFLNFYRCAPCKQVWLDQWSCTCDDECLHCGARDMTPCHSEDVTEFIERDGNEFVAIRSSDTAEDDPDYRELGRFPTRTEAETFLDSYEAG